MNSASFAFNFRPLASIPTNYQPISITNKKQKITLPCHQQINHRQDILHQHQQRHQHRNALISKSPMKQRKQSHVVIFRADSAKFLQNKRRNSNLCQNYKPTVYKTEKTIRGQHRDLKMEALYETSETIKDFKPLPIVRKGSFHPKINRSTRESIIKQKKINGDSFDIIKPIGKGKYGKVFLARQKDSGFILALKAIQKKKIIQSNLLEQFIRQLKIQFYLNHPGIIKLYGFFDDPENFYLLMELGCDGQLYDKIANKNLLSQQSSSFIARSMLEVVQYMHSQKVLHRDIKPENIVLILGHLKICDFGWAVYNNTEMRTTFCGTPMYFSPQLLVKQQYDEKVDLWAIGVMVFQLVVGKSPFNLRQPQDLGRIITHQVQFPKNIAVSQHFKNFILQILEKDPSKRPSSYQLLQTKFIKNFKNIQICQQLCRGPINFKMSAEIRKTAKNSILERV